MIIQFSYECTLNQWSHIEKKTHEWSWAGNDPLEISNLESGDPGELELWRRADRQLTGRSKQFISNISLAWVKLGWRQSSGDEPSREWRSWRVGDVEAWGQTAHEFSRWPHIKYLIGMSKAGLETIQWRWAISRVKRELEMWRLANKRCASRSDDFTLKMLDVRMKLGWRRSGGDEPWWTGLRGWRSWRVWYV